MDRQALILIDIQHGFAHPSWGQRNNPAFEANIATLLRAWRSREWPVVHVRHNSLDASSPLRPGQPGNDFMECAAPADRESVVEKTVNSAFIGTPLQALLANIGASSLVFAGLTTDHCVSTSVRMAANLGFVAIVAADATATYPRRDLDGRIIEADLVHRVTLASLDEEFARISATNKLITWRDA